MHKQLENICVGNYTVVRHIANGAFGCVFLVQHRHLRHRYFAMKLLNAKRLQSSYERDRFLQEARFLNALHFPGIPKVFESGIAPDGTAYIVLEYIPNGSLREFIMSYGNELMPFALALSVLSEVAEILSHTHQQGILHHDIKPENILFNGYWEAMLTDFGIALKQESIMLRRAAACVGTPEYMAPELYHGYASRRSDQYSLGVLAYELFTGQLPFQTDNRDELRKLHMHAQPIPPSHLNPALPRSIDRVILKALAKLRVNRFEDVGSFAQALQDASLAREPARQQSVIPAAQQDMRVW